ncbi:MAG TPA: esterase-like activity of phytase family protein [Acidiferrobacterales bacterium]|nr:esterase-like activity of phytase family protein [Acidiferrobacterales bacterium]
MDAFLRYFLLALLAAAPAAASRAQDSFPSLKAKAVDLCESPPACERIGKLRLLGMLELSARSVNGVRFAGLSGLAWNEDDNLLYALADHGILFHLRPVFRNGQLADVALLHSAPLIDPRTRKPVKWRRSDTEGLDILNGRNGRKGDAELIVSFEGEPRIARYRPDGQFIADVPLSDPLRNIRNYRYNRMLEAVCSHPREGVLTAPEEPLNGETGTARLYRTDGSAWRFAPSRGGIVALECLPDGDVLVMERDYTTLTLRWIITLRRLHLPAGTPPDSLLPAETAATLDSDQGLRIDNFEGLARHHGNRFFMVSDDNDVFVQRTLLVYFELLDR